MTFPSPLNQDDDRLAEARRRIAAQKGQLRGWRPLPMGDVAVVAVEVLGLVRGDSTQVGLRVMVAGRSAAAIDSYAETAIETALRRRSVLMADQPLHVQERGPLCQPTPYASTVSLALRPATDDILSWPWRPFVVHVPLSQLPAIGGLASDSVRAD